jgi:UDP-N-acetylglucosamine--N-acetylmuramyl-(pentapeptide) pyrophosphoryl-undecaprenol N-acetylglucosamine transferase
MAGGGTGGHVIPLVAVARELRRRGHAPFFVGTRQGLEARLVPAEGFPIEWIEIGALKRVGPARVVRTLWQLPRSVAQVGRLLKLRRPAAVFSMGGYAAGPAMLAAWLRGIPVVLMEPNAVAGLTNRWMGRFAARALVNFAEAAAQFPGGKTELAGLPVRDEFFSIPPKSRSGVFTLLITGGSQGSRRLNLAARQSWPLFRRADFPLRLIHQCGHQEHTVLAREFAASGLEGEVVPFLEDMPRALAEADLVVCRSGAGAVSELAAAGRPAILVPFPFAADQHQLRNAEALARAGAARLVPDAELTGERLFQEVSRLASDRDALERMGRAARSLARPGAAARAADILEELAGKKAGIDSGRKSRNNTIEKCF